MKLNFKNIGLIVGLGAVMAFQACTDLEPKLYSELDKDQFESTPEAFEGKLGDVYVNLQREYGYVYRQGYWAIQENTTDECFVPVRYNGDWYDDGFFTKLHNHTYDEKCREVAQWGQGGQNTWNFIYRGISKCNDMLNWMAGVYEKSDKSDATTEEYKKNVAELKILRAWYHYLALDVWGNVPWVSSLDPNATAKQLTRPELFDSIMTDLQKYVPQARKTPIYTRVDQQVGLMTLAKMFLNAEAWGVVGKAQTIEGLNAEDCYAVAASFCDQVIKSGRYSLMANYFDNFKVDNEKSTENIWCVYYDANFSKGMQFHCMTLHYVSKGTYGLTEQPWNGYCGHHRLMSLYEKKADAPTEGFVPNEKFLDKRVNCWERGMQEADAVKVPIDRKTYDLMPKYVRKPADYPNRTQFETMMSKGEKYDGYFPPFFTDTVTTLSNTADYKIYNIFEGPRFVKFEIQRGVGVHMSNDFPIYRLADTKLMLAEAICRAGGNVSYQTLDGQDVTLTMADAQAAYEEVRSRAGLTKHFQLQPGNENSSETMGELCNERCRELMWEGHRRQDLIRFDRFSEKNARENPSDPYNLWILRDGEATRDKELMPLPDFAVDNGLTQNPGY